MSSDLSEDSKVDGKQSLFRIPPLETGADPSGLTDNFGDKTDASTYDPLFDEFEPVRAAPRNSNRRQEVTIPQPQDDDLLNEFGDIGKFFPNSPRKLANKSADEFNRDPQPFDIFDFAGSINVDLAQNDSALPADGANGGSDEDAYNSMTDYSDDRLDTHFNQEREPSSDAENVPPSPRSVKRKRGDGVTIEANTQPATKRPKKNLRRT